MVLALHSARTDFVAVFLSFGMFCFDKSAKPQC